MVFRKHMISGIYTEGFERVQGDLDEPHFSWLKIHSLYSKIVSIASGQQEMKESRLHCMPLRALNPKWHSKATLQCPSVHLVKVVGRQVVGAKALTTVLLVDGSLYRKALWSWHTTVAQSEDTSRENATYIGLVVNTREVLQCFPEMKGEKYELLFRHISLPALLPTTYSYGCSRKFKTEWLKNTCG